MNKENSSLVFLSLFLCLILICAELHAQKESANWYFGYECGLNFNFTPPLLIDSSAMVTKESCSSISDKEGNLLFYTNGVDVWNRDHKKMYNGYDLKGHISANQGTIIIPQPGSTSIYYIFSTSALEVYPQQTGLYYSVVDMTSDCGKGDVVLKNMLLHTNTTEGINAVLHADGESIWIGSIIMPNIFAATQISCNGIHATKYSYLIDSFQWIGNMMGSIVFSPNSKYLSITYPIQNPSGVAIYNFDNETGFLKPVSFIDRYGIFCTTFTNDSKSLVLLDQVNKEIVKYDLEVSSQLHLPVTIPLGSDFTLYKEMHGIQLSFDGSIYFGLFRSFLDVDTFCSQNTIRFLSYSDGNFNLSNIEYQFPVMKHFVWLHLPNFIQSYFDPFFQADLGCDTVVCAGTPVALSYYPGASVLWSTGDTTEVLTATEPGVYSVIAAHPDNPGWIRYDTIRVVHKPCTEKCNELQTWPNPNHGQFTVSVEAALPATLDLFTRNGQRVASEMLEANHLNPYPIATRLSAGTYLLRYANEVCQETMKVTVIKKK
jgi:hypothetical protein